MDTSKGPWISREPFPLKFGRHMHGGRIINANNFIEGGQRINAGECTKLMCDLSDGETPRADEVDSDLIPRVGSDVLWGEMSLSLSRHLVQQAITTSCNKSDGIFLEARTIEAGHDGAAKTVSACMSLHVMIPRSDWGNKGLWQINSIVDARGRTIANKILSSISGREWNDGCVGCEGVDPEPGDLRCAQSPTEREVEPDQAGEETQEILREKLPAPPKGEHGKDRRR